MKYKGFSNQVNQLTRKEYIVGNSLEIEAANSEEEVRKDIEIQDLQNISIWGQLKDCNNKPIVGEYVRLIRIHGDKETETLEIVKAMVTDEKGYYRFNIYGKESEQYTVLVDYKMLNTNVSLSAAELVKKKIGLVAAKHKSISNYVKF